MSFFELFSSDALPTYAKAILAFLQGLFTTSHLSFIMNIVSYILLSLGMYTIAKRRNIRHPWMAWVPVCNTWLLGCISDQYQYATRHRENDRRKTLLVLQILIIALSAVTIGVVIAMLIDVLGSIPSIDSLDYLPEVLATRLLRYAVWIIILGLATGGLGIALAVVSYMAYHDLFASCDPNNKTIFLVLGIFFNLLLSIFVFYCRKNDYGMPYGGTNPNVWTPPQPSAEPWNQERE